MPAPRFRLLALLATLMTALLPGAGIAGSASMAAAILAEPVCGEQARGHYPPIHMAARVSAYQVLSEEALSLRAQAIALLQRLKETEQRGEPLSGAELQALNGGAAALLEQRELLWMVATAHECWLDDPLPDDPAQARVRAAGIAMSLSAALILYDNYLAAIGLYRADPFLRRHLNRGDSGFEIPEGQLNLIAASFASAVNRARVRRGLVWFERHGGVLARSQDDGERYLVELIEQSPAHQMVRRLRPVDYAQNLLGFFGVLSVDTLRALGQQGVDFSSMVFGNAVGLVEVRRGKLDGRPELSERLAGRLQAGDILLEKTPFRLTDVFIPGHWGHAAVWIGNEAELRQLGVWDHPVVRRHQAAIRRGAGVVEALRSGVEINPLERFLNVDDLAVLRRRESDPAARAAAVVQALREVGKAYDFSFDVESTDRIVCSELVYHAYGGIRWPTRRTLGRATVSPDNIAVQATGDGPLAVVELYHDGEQVAAAPRQRLAELLVPEVVQVAYGDGALSP